MYEPRVVDDSEQSPGGSAPSSPIGSATLFGRAQILGTVLRLIDDPAVRLVTLTGPGGVGKTRLASEVATLRPGTIIVSLAPIADESLVPQAIAAAAGIQSSEDAGLLELVVAEFGRGDSLLVLDNLEHLPAIGTLVRHLLECCPALRILGTSRRRLHLGAEYEVPVPPLTVPDPGSHYSTRDLCANPAVGLFMQRSRAANAAFALTDANAAAVAAICRQLDGLPLAIELAAARCRYLSADALLARLERRLDVLACGPRDLPDRQRTMRDAIAWSYDLLSERERAFFRRAAIFTGGFTVEAAEAVAGLPALDLVESLNDHGLLLATANENGEPRLTMLETVREFGLEQLDLSGERDAVPAAHATFFCRFAVDAGPRLIGNSVEQLRWWNRLVADIANFRAAIEWLEANGNPVDALRVVGELDWFWTEYTYVDEGRRRLAHLLALDTPDMPIEVRAKGLSVAAMLADIKGAHEETFRFGQEATALWRQAGRMDLVSRSLYDLANGAYESADFDRALELGIAALESAAAIGDVWYQAAAHVLLGTVKVLGKPDLAVAADHFSVAIELFRGIGDMSRINGAVSGLGFTQLVQGELQNARATYLSALAIEEAHISDRIYAPGIFSGLGTIVARSDELHTGIRLISAGVRMETETGVPLRKPVRNYFERVAAEFREQIGEGPFAAAWAAGQALDFAAAAALARTAPATPDASGAGNALAGLSRRELEVLRLLMDGRSDQEIADELFISRRTASQHVSAILGKLNVNTRAAAAVLATKHGLR